MPPILTLEYIEFDYSSYAIVYLSKCASIRTIFHFIQTKRKICDGNLQDWLVKTRYCSSIWSDHRQDL